MECHQDYKHNIIKNLHKAVKLCQTEFVNKNEVATECNIIISQLCKEWEVIFCHGIKKRSNKSIFSLKYNNISEIPNNFIQQIKPFSNQNIYSFWAFICEFLESDEIIRFTDTLDKIDTDIGRCRAWLRAAINEQTLEPFFVKVVSKNGQNIARKYYENFAILLDAEENSVLPNLAAGISSIMFALELNNENFNNFTDSSNRSQNNSTSSSMSRPVLFSSSTSGSFEDIEIIEPNTKPINGDSNAKNISKRKNRIINIVPIDDDDGGTSDSSDLYSPFNLLKNSVLNTGLNLVSKFQFGNDERLSNIQEQESKSSQTNLNNPVLINGEFREFGETEFEDCCLSLQNEFYSSLNNELSINHNGITSESANQIFVSADLLVVEPVVYSSSYSDLSTASPSIVSVSSPISTVACTNSENLINNHIQESREISDLKNQLLVQSEQNNQLRSELTNVKKELRNQEKLYKSDLSKLSRENELLKKRLKLFLMNNEEMETSGELSDELPENCRKVEQLLQMHADILELNDQLQRSLVDKDIKLSMLQSKVSELMQNEESSGIHFDNFGTIYIGIVDYFQRGSGLHKHFCYKIHIRCCPSQNSSVTQNDEWTTFRRYNEFHKFYLEFISRFPNVKNISFPSKWVYKPTEEQLNDRQKGLESFLHVGVNYIFRSILNGNNSDLNRKPVTYESFKRAGRWSWGSLDSASVHNSLNFLEETLTSDHTDRNKYILTRQNFINTIPFLAPCGEEI